MYRLIESTDYPALLARYLQDYDHYSRADPLGDTPLIVPTLPVGNILIQTLASQRGIAAGITLRLWHNYEWMLVERITGKSRSSSQAPLGNTAIRWELFSYLYQHGNTILADPGHPQHALLRGLYPDTDKITHDHTRRLWVYSGQLANLYSTYLNQRPEWLSAWQNADPPPLDALLKNDSLQQLPPQIADHYRALYQQQSRLWHDRFAAIHAERERRRETFWQTLKTRESARRLLPPYIPVFAPTHLHAAEHDFMRRLGNYTDLTHYHLAASDGYIDDIVDSRWLRELKARAAGKPSGEHREHGHELLSRYGKQQRDLSRLLHADSDPEPLPATPAPPHNLLTALQAEIRELKEDHVAACLAATTLPPSLQSGGRTGRGCENRAATNPDHQTPQDHSLRIHGCHSLQRQCETLRSDIVAWLNADPSRRLSDIYIHLPDPAAAQTTLRATFPPGGDYDGNRLPARLIGVTENPAENLWRSLAGRYTLINGRFDAPTVLDWLHNEDTCHSLGINSEHMQRITAALVAAGYRRGYDGAHLQPTLHTEDHDHRYTYTYALNRLIAGVLTPDADHYREAVPQHGLTLADLPALEALATLAENMHTLRALQAENTPAQNWLQHLRATLHDAYTHAHNSPAWQTLDQALDDLQNQLAAHQALAPQNEQHYLPLEFILENIENQLADQQNSSEPSGVITIGSLKNLRNLPGKLHIFLNADHDRYPARQNDERYNLIHLDKPRPGDNNREHEDLGALLDLINRAGDALWLYYNSHHDNEPQPPASPVQELLQYLDDQHERASQHLRASGRLDAGQTLPRHYHTEHPADPFQPDAHETRPAPLWENIRTTLQQNTPTATETSPPPVGEGWGGVRPQTALPNSQLVSPDEPPPSQDALASAAGEGWGGGSDRKTTATVASSTNTSPETLANMPPSTREGGARPHAWLSNSQPAPQKTFLPLHIPPALAADAAPQNPENLTLAQIVRDLQKPASAYARAHHIANTAAQTPPESREPLALYGLDNWQADQHIIAALEQNHPDPATHIARLPAYPGGISGQIQLEQRLATYRARQQTLLDRADLATWPTLREQTLNLGEHSSLTALLPAHSPTWPRLSASRAKPKHHARYWLEHLAWNATGAHGTTLIHYADDTLLRLAPLPAADAQRQLHQWLAVREHLQKNLWLAPLELMQPYLETFTTDKAADKQAALVRDWIHDDSHKNDDGDLWRHLWRGNENILAANIAAALATHAPLLQPLLEHGETLK
ncbi:Exodeoxyribonuclease V gamma chain [Cardiobacterium hominis]|uniref:Putative exodeoxyribonuclease V, gamma subunit n=1 Tax=Cardiobacterium hominis (strain ATCC 15826 / DSM 8339 / NCTC 10426 / 6573) TaxID=638300 RepID=C8NCI0_CARH6|nr:exodeoxyribonuclease V subunit gamma [Cardiobacterium hominis]EEV87676.1 putative exodeoxyribonuclease V, gamma subunit [Cardiobacterium hominis ATCC 15826]VEG77501.1 Exodeoxyribonuclease V gamma chain [Cardiobacterium hominis]